MDRAALDFHRKGVAAFRASRFKEAGKQFSSLLSAGHRFPDVLNMMGVIAYESGSLEAAEVYFREAVERNSNYTEAGLNLVVTLNDQGRHDEAEEVFATMRRASGAEWGAVDPYVKGKIANLHAELGDLYRAAALNDDALREYRTALRLAAGFPDVRTHLGVLMRDMGFVDDAVGEFLSVLRENPDYVPALVELGVAHYGRGQVDEAVARWRDALERDPENGPAMRYLKVAKRKKKKKR
jgi:tetratricopeptide (TPR) repeat protein